MKFTENVAASTFLLHRDRKQGMEFGALRAPVHASIQYGYDRVEDLIDIFQGRKRGAFNYSRQGTPTTAALEAKITVLEEGVGTVCFATGMGALASVFLTLLKAGDGLLSSQHVFGNTNSLFGTLRQHGVDVAMIDMSSAAAVEEALTPSTKMVFVETIANPGTQIADLKGIGELCRQRGLVYVVDNTITSPALFVPKSVGASLVVNSLSKTLSGHGTALGGAVTDTGLFDWVRYPNIGQEYRNASGPQQALLQIRKKGLRDMGASLSSEQASQISIGMETLDLRINKSSENARILAEYLASHTAVKSVSYPGLASHAHHSRSKELFRSPSWLLSFELKNDAKTNQLLNTLIVPVVATGLGDTRTLVLPVASTIFWEAGEEKKREMGIPEGMIRVSVGIESIDDIIFDFDRALSEACDES